MLGRSDDIIVIKGVKVFPSQVESILMEMEGVEPRYQIIADRVEGVDTLEMKVEVNESVFSDEIKNLQNIGSRDRTETAGDRGDERQGEAGRPGEPAAEKRQSSEGDRPEEKLKGRGRSPLPSQAVQWIVGARCPRPKAYQGG